MAKRQSVSAILRKLDRGKANYGDDAAVRKCELLTLLQNRHLPSARDVGILHDALCFLRAYPDDAQLLAQVERMLDGFDARSDLRRFAATLADSGIAGTPIHFSFYAQTACWLARRWGAHLAVDWKEFENTDKIEALLPLLALYCETPALDECGFETRAWIQRLKAPHETDAAFLIQRFGQMKMSSFMHELLYEQLDIPLRLSPGPNTPARTQEKYAGLPTAHQAGPLQRGRPSLPAAIALPPLSVRSLSSREGAKIVDLARSAMVVRSRDLDAFAYGDKNDVRLADCGNGLQFAYIGLIPERRLLLETLYGYVMLKNGVPVGYGAAAALFESAEIAYTVFDTFRGGESAFMFARALAVAKHMLNVDTFTIEPSQLGEDNDDGLRSGAWWFYQKLGFRPRDTVVKRIMREELRAMKKDPAHRSTIPTLRELASANVFYELGERRDDVLGVLPAANVGLEIMNYVSQHFGFDRDKALRTCSTEAAGLLGLRSLRGFTPGERLAWQRWAPLLLILPRVKTWSVRDKRALVDVVRAKGGTCESEYLRRFDRHRRLRRAIRSLAAKG